MFTQAILRNASLGVPMYHDYKPAGKCYSSSPALKELLDLELAVTHQSSDGHIGIASNSDGLQTIT